MNASFTELQWLPPPRGVWRGRLKSLDSMDACLGRELVSVASHALDTNQLVQLAGGVERSRARGATLAPPIPFRLALLARATSIFQTFARPVAALFGGLDRVVPDTTPAGWHDTQLWNLGKFPFAERMIPQYADHYGRRGFTNVAGEGSGLTRWELGVASASVAESPMRVISRGFGVSCDLMDSFPAQQPPRD